MAAAAMSVSDLFASDDDFDKIMSMIDGNIFEEAPEFVSEIEVNTSETFKCRFCEKVCLSKGGLSRHNRVKHPPVVVQDQCQAPSQSTSTAVEKLHPMFFYNYVKDCASNLFKSGCYPQQMLQEFGSICMTNNPANDEWRALTIYEPFSDVISSFCGKPDLFYPKFYKVVNSTSEKSPFSLSKKAHLVFGYDLANYVLAHLSKGKFVDGCIVFPENKTSLSDRLKAIITYLGGYVVSTLFRRIRFSKAAHNVYQQQCMSILLASKCENDEPCYQNAEVDGKLVAARQRGGLWRINKHAVSLFSIVELQFQSSNKTFSRSIDSKEIVDKLMHHSELLCDFTALKHLCTDEIEISNEVALDLLQDILMLYVRARAFSFTKDIKINHDVNKGKSRATKSLRAEIKNASSNLNQGN